MKKIITAIVLAGACVGASAADPLINVPNGFFTGSDFRQWDELSRRLFVSGAVDGFLGGGFMAARSLPRVANLKSCLTAMQATDGQLALIVGQFIDSHPVRLNETLGTLTFAALYAACKEHGTSLD
jgi:hypothetical protein